MSNLSPVVTAQVKPSGGKLKVSFLIIKSNDLDAGNGVVGVHAAVARDVIARLNAGEDKYGSPLRTFNGRSADLDIYQELCDGIAYFTQKIFETKSEAEVLPLIDDCDTLYKIAGRCRERLVRDGILEN